MARVRSLNFDSVDRTAGPLTIVCSLHLGGLGSWSGSASPRLGLGATLIKCRVYWLKSLCCRHAGVISN